ncbi:diguanylate cyclase domain-containing protein [Ramlibacter albus]|uniref:Diguanylate cyclase n=1 Tax=Ramlibacter albus TaxID=2079448 RepID=A0A923S1D2_9BURK|nr:diguanylate cyclase [Ramlibacter albus]MBC5764299.1 diguanylate cyclase [Ramlibacter albus]
MDVIAAGFWGAFFGAAVLMFGASLYAFARSLRRVALMAALSSVVSALFVVAYLGWLPVGDADAQARLLAHVAMLSAVVLALMLLSMLGWLRRRELARPAVAALVATGVLVAVIGWFLEPVHALVLSSAVAFLVGATMLGIALRSALNGDSLGWAAVAGVWFMLLAVIGLTWIAVDRNVAWPVHAVSATAGVAYLAVMAAALWTRYSYLLELSEVMAHGPSYDPVTRMRSHSETSQMLGDIFVRRPGERQPIGIVVVSIANLYALENLHGRAAFNHALFLCASRLRRVVPAGVATGRLGDDGFLLVMHDVADPARLVQLARQLRERLSRPVILSTGRDPGELDTSRTEWRAEVGVGLLTVYPQVRPSQALAMVRAMSRTAWSYASRIAWFDDARGEIAELPIADAA